MPSNYLCPFCLVVKGEEDNKLVQTKQQDIIYKDEHVTALIATLWWPNNKGHVIIIPNDHYENIFDLPIEIATRIHKLSQQSLSDSKSVTSVMVSQQDNIMNRVEVRMFGITTCMYTLDISMIIFI